VFEKVVDFQNVFSSYIKNLDMERRRKESKHMRSAKIGELNEHPLNQLALDQLRQEETGWDNEYMREYRKL